MRKYVVFILGTLLLTTLFAGCGRPSRIEVPTGQEFTLYQGQTVQIKEGTQASLSITFKSVTEDSRCASDVVCIQAGRVSCQLDITELKGSNTPTPVTLTQPPVTQIFGVYQLSYNVLPYPVSTRTIKQSDYYIVMTVTQLAGK